MAKKHHVLLKRLGWLFLFFTVLASLVGSHLLLSSPASAQIVRESDCPSGEYIATGPGNYGPAYCFGPQTCEANEGTWTGSSCRTNSAGLPMQDVYSDADPWKQVMMQLYTRAIVTCAEYTSTLSLSAANNTDTWFWSAGGAGTIQRNYVYSSLLDTDDDGALACTNEKGWLDTALRELGFTDKIIALCTIGYQRTGGDGSYTDCIKGQGDRFEFKIDRFDIFNRFKTALGIDTSMVHRSGQTIGSSATATGDVLRYLFYKKIMESRVGCSATLLPINSSSDDDLTPGQVAKRDAGGGAIISLVEPATAPGTGFGPKWYFAVWEPDGKEVRVAPGFGQNNPGNQWRIIREANSLSWSPAWNDQNSCIQISQYINATALNYTTWAKANPDLAKQAEASSQAGDGTAPGRTTCAIDGIGWFMCPIMSGIGWVVDGLYKWVESTLIINPLDTHTDAGTQTVTYTAWQNMRNIANVILVIGFLIIIFSQLTGAGVSNYGVKKLLPRLVIVAIAINISYLLMQIVVDVVNIIGVSIVPILNAATPDTTINFGDTVDKFLAGSLVGVSALAAGGIFVVGAGGFAAAAIIVLIFLLGAFLSLIAAFFTIFMRNAIVIILAIVAPIAIAAYLLPNTERLFDQWRKLLTSMLFLFPTVALLFGGSKLASAVVGGQNDWWAPFVAMFIAAAPLGLLPFVIRSSNKILSTIGGGLQKLAQRTTQGARGVAQPFLDARKAEYKSGQRNVFGRERSEATRLRRRTIGQKLDQDKQKLESRAKTAKTEAEADFKRRGTDAAAGLSTRRADQSIARVTEAAGAAGAKNQAEDARVKERITQRMMPGGDLRDVATKIRDAEKGAGRNEKISEAAFMVRDRRAVETGGVTSASTGENLADIIHQTRDANEEIQGDETFLDVQQEARVAEGEASTVSGESLLDIRQETMADKEAQRSATDSIQEQYAEEAATNPELAARAAGVAGAAGVTRVRARAAQTSEDARQKDVAAVSTLLRDRRAETRDMVGAIRENTSPLNPGQAPTTEELMAAIDYVGRYGTVEEIAQIGDILAEPQYTPNENTEEGRRNIRVLQSFGSMLEATKRVRSYGGGAVSALKRGQQPTDPATNQPLDFAGQIQNRVRNERIDPKAVASYDVDEIRRYIDFFDPQHPEYQSRGATIDMDHRQAFAQTIREVLDSNNPDYATTPEARTGLQTLLGNLGVPNNPQGNTTPPSVILPGDPDFRIPR